MAADTSTNVIPSDVSKPKDEQLKEILASASHQYAMKAYETASDLYAQAAELQDEMNGEMNPENAELLYAYGRCLHHLAVSKSDVLGGKVAGPTDGGAVPKRNKSKKRKRGDDTGEGNSSAAAGSVAKTGGDGDAVAEEIVEKIVEDKDGVIAKEREAEVRSKGQPFFQISGDDAEWEEEDDELGGTELDDDAEDAEAEEEEDDFAIAYEILDTARILMARQIENLQDGLGKGKGKEHSDQSHPSQKEIRSINERLADTHDLQAEISLENERFQDAISDSRASLELKKALYEPYDGLVSEAHYKLSLALEFASVTTPKDENGAPIEGAAQEVDEVMRAEAAREMEAAVESSKSKLEKETEGMVGLTGDELKRKQVDKKEFEEIIADMEQRVSAIPCSVWFSVRTKTFTQLEDLRKPPVSVNDASGPAGASIDNNPLGGILGEMLGESPQAFKARIEEASKGANDLSGLVKHKKKPVTTNLESSSSGDVKGKRKASADVADASGDSKRVRTPGP